MEKVASGVSETQRSYFHLFGCSAPPRLRVRLSAAWVVAVMSTSALAQEPLPGIKRLDDTTRAKALAALAALIILGFAMILLTWLGARITQRYRNSSAFFKPTIRPGEHEWSRKPLGEADTKGNE